MKNNFENSTLTLFFEGELNSYNSEDVENEIESILAEKEIKAIIIDCENLTYISSAGLRIIARLKQQFDDISLVKVPSGVYDILEMVGFQNMFKIKKL